MDSNGTCFLLLADAQAFATDQDDLAWDEDAGGFGLVQRQPLRLPRPVPAAALLAWEAAETLVMDARGQLGRLTSNRRELRYSPGWPASGWQSVRAEREQETAANLEALELTPVTAPEGTRFTDLAIGADGLLALPFSDDAERHGLILVHLRGRWRVSCPLPERAVRAWIGPGSDFRSEVWLAGATRLMRCAGSPLPRGYQPRAERFEPLAPNPDPLRLIEARALPLGDLTQVRVLAMTGDDRRLLVLIAHAHDDDSGPTQSLLALPLTGGLPAGAIAVAAIDPACPFATDLAALGDGRYALLAPRDPDDSAFRNRDCAVVTLDQDSPRPAARLIHRRWPMRSLAAARFVHALDGKVRYLADDGPRELIALPQARFPAAATGTLRHRLDSGLPDCLWHRLVFEACIPAGCAIEVRARVADIRTGLTTAGWDLQAAPTWRPLASELPWDPGRLATIPNRQGLFEVLLQRPNGSVRELRGRYLQLRLTLSGDGRQTPRIRALRAWFPRHSWQQAFLPEHFHQQERPSAPTPSPRTAPEPANGADVRERLLAAFEGMLTPLEDRIASAEVLLDPLAAPATRLPMLAGMLGSRPPPAWPEPRRRRWLAEAGRLQRSRGTVAGLALALDIATDGLVGRGQVVPVENFRLRRTLATVLGIAMDDADHPLTLGTGQSGNSLIGPGLILTDEDAREFLALFAPELAADEADSQRVDAFFDRYARRLTLILHAEARALRGTIEEVMAEQMPAAVQWVIRETEHPFVLGLSPLLGIDTLLECQPTLRPVVADRSRLDRGDLLHDEAVFG